MSNQEIAAKITPEQLHYVLMQHVIKHGHAPDPDHLAKTAGCGKAEADEALARLAEMHGVILEPGSARIWSLHPFSMLPSAFWVSTRDQGWWANCAWCSIAIGTALHTDIEISTRDGAEGKPLLFTVRNGNASRPDLLMHFPYPPARWWDNPYCPCGNILFFSSEKEVDAWCHRHARPKGALLSMSQALRLTERWFGDYASPGWRRKTRQAVEAIFAELGLDPGFWNVSGSFR